MAQSQESSKAMRATRIYRDLVGEEFNATCIGIKTLSSGRRRLVFEVAQDHNDNWSFL